MERTLPFHKPYFGVKESTPEEITLQKLIRVFRRWQENPNKKNTKDLQELIELFKTQIKIKKHVERILSPYQQYQPQVRQIVPKTEIVQQQPTDPTRTILTWREFSNKVADRIDAVNLTEINTEAMLDEEMTLMMNEILEIFEDYLWLMMQKGIMFATEEMNRLSPKYHFTAGWQPSDDQLLADLLTGCRTYLTNWTGDIRAEAAKEIREGIRLGESTEQIGKRVADTIQSHKWRGTLIARTELMRAWNVAAHDRYSKAGFGMLWMTARDPIVCEICQPLDGKPISEIGMIPPAHPNGRCGIKPVLPSPPSP